MKRLFIAVGVLLAGLATMAFLSKGTSAQWNWRTNSSSSVTSSDLAMVPTRSALLIPSGDDSLTRKIVQELALYLRAEELFEEVEVATFPSIIRVGGRSPDAFIKIARKKAEGERMNGNVHESYEVTLANVPWTSISGYSDDNSPPLISHSSTIRLDGMGTLAGWNFNKHELIAKEISSKVGEELKSRLATLRKEYAEMAKFPDIFYGPYLENAGGLALPGFEIHTLQSYCGFFSHNSTYWLIENASREKLFEALRTQLKDEGWAVEGERENLRATRKNESWTIFSKEKDEHSAEVCDMIACYENKFTKEEQSAAIDALFEANAPTDLLFAFDRNMSQQQREELIRRMELSPGGSPKVYLRLAQVYQRQSRKEEALRMVAAASAFDATLENSDSGSEISRISRELTGKATDPVLSPDILRELGFIEVSPLGEWGVQRKIGEAGYFFFSLPNDEVAIATARLVLGNRAAAREFQAIHSRSKPGMGRSRSFSKRKVQVDASGHWRDSDATTVNSLCIKLGAEVTGDKVWYTADLMSVPSVSGDN